MNRDLFNQKKKLSEMPDNPDATWADDVSFDTLEKKIRESKKATLFALRPLDDKTWRKEKALEREAAKSASKAKGDGNAALKSPKTKGEEYAESKKFPKKFVIFMSVWSASLILLISAFLFFFYKFLEDYEKVYNESLPYHVMDDFLGNFEPVNIDYIYSGITEKPEICEFETEENVKNYLNRLLDSKEISYVEDRDSTEKTPVFLLTADNYVFGKVSMVQGEDKRNYDLPKYRINKFEMYCEPEWNVSIKSYDNCVVYVNGIALNDSYLYRTDPNKETHFEDYVELPDEKYYKISSLYERPDIRVINEFNQEVIPEVNNTTGVFETPFSAPEEIENEMIDFAKDAVSVYAQVVCREINDSALDRIFIKNSMIAKEIKQNSGNLKYFPSHVTNETEDEIIEFIPYREDAFYCEIKHVQHMVIYGARPRDVETDARIYCCRENGEWKVYTMLF